MEFLDFIRKYHEEHRRDFVIKGGPGSGWYKPPKGSHVGRTRGAGWETWSKRLAGAAEGKKPSTRRGGGEGGKGKGGMTSAERSSAFAKAESGKWYNARHGNVRHGVVFSDAEKDANGDAVRKYSYNTHRGSRRTSGSGVIRLKDSAVFDYMDRNGNLRTPLRGHDALDAIKPNL